MGRPTISPKNTGYRLRMSDDEMAKLEECCDLSGLSKADVIRMGINIVHANLKQEQPPR